ncbi:Low-density lipoprotein receptor-related protein 1B [Fukomys damarensis]|uniref:Low-density lipoprotein receptor-related protein 1B n=1 Tax=Fukomys damarensis TaxID=885580 RepID=A0A091CU74_FUKDA|nr:Low-density lipoprotein receptor-related protein 1B [Fukomys damarensis]
MRTKTCHIKVQDPNEDCNCTVLYCTVYLKSTNRLNEKKGPEDVEIKCSLNHIACLGTDTCIHLSQLCNGVLDCSDGYDEGAHCHEIFAICRREAKGLLDDYNYKQKQQ